MKTFVALFLLSSINNFAKDAPWIAGKWQGYCVMSTGQLDGSEIISYEFKADFTGYLRHQSFRDNRCGQLKDDSKSNFSFAISDEVGPQVTITLNYKKPTKGKATQSRFSFQRLGTGNRATIGMIYLYKEIGADGKEKTIIDSEKGELSALPTSLFSRGD